MTYLIVVSVSIALLVGFIVLTQYEARHAMRFFLRARADLDAFVTRAEFIIENVDLLAFARDEIRHATNRIGHFFAHITLQVVRWIERQLTRLVRYLRTRNEDTVAPRENAREFVKTLTDFKDGLNATHPDIDALDTVPEVE